MDKMIFFALIFGTVAVGSTTTTNNTTKHPTSDDVVLDANANTYWFESSLARVMPNSSADTAHMQDARISLARNEHESFQIALRPLVNTTYSVSIVTTNLMQTDNGNVNATQPSSLQLKWEQVGLVYVPAIVSNTQGGAGWWPDPTLRTSTAFGLVDFTTSIWITAYAPFVDVAAGVHTITVTLTPSTTNTGTTEPTVDNTESSGNRTATATATPIVVTVQATVYNFALPVTPVLQTAFDLGEAALAKVYNESGASRNISDTVLKQLWAATGCSNPFSATSGEQPLWHSSTDGGANDMYTYCMLTKQGTATPGQKAVCGSVPGECHLQHLPGSFDPSRRAGHATFVEWSRWLLTNFSLNPGTIYSPPIPFTVSELETMRDLGLNSFTAFPAHVEYVNNTDIATYVKELDAAGLSKFATTYGYDESDALDEMESTFGALKAVYPTISTFTTAHMCGSPNNWQQPLVPCYGTCPGPSCRNGTSGLPVQDPAQIKRRNIDYMCPILDWVKPPNMTDCESTGLKMWMYTSLEPWGNFCNFRFDNDLYESRFLFWQMAQLRLTGFLYWNLNAWQGHAPPGGVEPNHVPIDEAKLTTPFIDPANWTPWQSLPRDVGDGKLTYGGVDGPIASIRLHGVRDGIEDFAYFSLLKQLKGDAVVQAILANVTTPGNLQHHIGNRTGDLGQIMAVRDAVAMELEAANF